MNALPRSQSMPSLHRIEELPSINEHEEDRTDLRSLSEALDRINEQEKSWLKIHKSIIFLMEKYQQIAEDLRQAEDAIKQDLSLQQSLSLRKIDYKQKFNQMNKSIKKMVSEIELVQQQIFYRSLIFDFEHHIRTEHDSL